MFNRINSKFLVLRRYISAFIIFCVLFTLAIPAQVSQAQSMLKLPAIGAMIAQSPVFIPAHIAGMTIYPDNPLKFNFIIDVGDDSLQGEELKQESEKLIKYFMASLTVPEDEMWVNLSPYEKNRIIADGLGKTDMGKDMLAQDYFLKQLTASLMFPENELGAKFWDRVYEKAQEQYGTTEIPMNTFNKIWIVPKKASVYVTGKKIFVVENYLTVMLEEDYLALESNQDHENHGVGQLPEKNKKEISSITSDIVREILVPEIEKEVNEGKNFANLRQIFYSMILATWFKQNLKESILGQVYFNKNIVKGIDINESNIKDKVYEQYLEAYKIGVYELIKEDYDPTSQEIIPRKYFSGGIRGLKKVDSAKISEEWLSWRRERKHVEADGAMMSNGDPNMTGDRREPSKQKRKKKDKGPNDILALMFTSEAKAAYGVWSEEIELGEIVEPKRKTSWLSDEEKAKLFTPAPLKGLRERHMMWDFIRTPTTDLDVITARQDFLEVLRKFNRLEEINELKNKAYFLHEGIEALFSPIQIGRGVVIPINEYRDPHGDSAVNEIVERGLKNIREGKAALKELLELLSQMDHPIIRKVTESLRLKLSRIQHFDDNYFLKQSLKPARIRKLTKSINTNVEQFGCMSEFARIIVRDNYTRAGFNPDKEIGYEEGWSFVFEKFGEDPQVFNDSPLYKLLTILCGPNSGGKSYDLEKNFFMQLLAQSFGFVPCKNGNFQIHDALLYIDKAPAKVDGDLGSFVTDVENWKLLWDKIGENPFLVVDEGFATTSSSGEDQTRLLIGVGETIKVKGGRVLYSSHNEKFVAYYLEDDDVGIYHFPIELKDGRPVLDEDGKPKFTYKLTSGVGDAMAIDILETMGLDEDFIKLAREFVAKIFNHVSPQEQREWREPKAYTPEERAAIKEKGGLPIKLEKASDENTLRYSTKNPHFENSGKMVVPDKWRSFPFGRIIRRYDRNNWLYQLLLHGQKLSSQEILERRKMFIELSKNDRFEEFQDIGNRLHWINQVLPSIFDSPVGVESLLNFNTHFVPNRSQAHYGELDVYVEQIFEYYLMLLRMNKKILRNDFPPLMDKFLDQFEQQHRINEAYRAYWDEMDLFDVKEAKYKDLDEEITEPELIEKWQNLSQDKEPEKEKWNNKLTRKRIREYLLWLEKNDKKEYYRFQGSLGEEAEFLKKVMKGYSWDLTYDETIFVPEDYRDIFLEKADLEPTAAKEKWGDKICIRRIREYVEYLYKEHAHNEEREHQAGVFEGWIEAINKEQAKMQIDNEEIKKTFNDLYYPEGKAPQRLDGQEIHQREFQYFNNELITPNAAAFKAIPAKSIFGCNLEEISEELRFFAHYFYNDYQQTVRSKNYKSGAMKRALNLSLILEILSDQRNYHREYVDLMQTYDSLHMLHLSEDFKFSDWELYGRSSMDPDYTEEMGEKLFLEDLGGIFDGGFRQMFENLNAIKRSFDQTYERVAKESRFNISDAVKRSLSSSHEEVPPESRPLFPRKRVGDWKILLESQDTEDRDRINEVIRIMGALTGKSYPKHMIYDDTFQYEKEAALARYRRLYKEVLIDTGKLEEIREIVAEFEGFHQEVEDFIREYGIEFEKGEATKSMHAIWRGDFKPIMRVLQDRFRTNFYQPDYGVRYSDSKFKNVSELVVKVQALSLFGHMMNTDGYSPVDYNASGLVDITNMFSIFKKKDEQTLNDARYYSDEIVREIAGPNQAGKSFSIEELAVATTIALNTGIIPAEKATMPLFDHVFFIDRIVQRLNKKLGALGNEAGPWKEFFELIKEEANIFVLLNADEPYSTVPAVYQSAAVYAIVMLMIMKGQYTTIISHNHDVMKLLRELESEFVKAYTIDIDTQGEKIKYFHKLRPVQEDEETLSHAIDIARDRGMPEEILQIAEKVELDAAMMGDSNESGKSQLVDKKKNHGGIDFNPNNLELKMQGEEFKFNIELDSFNFQSIPRNGLTPIIYQITPISDFQLFIS